MRAEIDQPGGSGPNYWRLAGWGAALCLLLLPLAAMQFTEEVQWTLSGFVFAAVLIGGTGLAFETVVRVSSDIVYRLGFAIVLGATFLMVWINAAVGIIGAEDNDANLLYGVVLIVGILLGSVGRLRAMAMARAAGATALAQLLLTVVAVVLGWGQPASPALELLALNGFFIACWLCATVLFVWSARQQPAEVAN